MAKKYTKNRKSVQKLGDFTITMYYPKSWEQIKVEIEQMGHHSGNDDKKKILRVHSKKTGPTK
jgi:hypothetical protein